MWISSVSPCFLCLFDDAETQDPRISFHIVASLSGGVIIFLRFLGLTKTKKPWQHDGQFIGKP